MDAGEPKEGTGAGGGGGLWRGRFRWGVPLLVIVSFYKDNGSILVNFLPFSILL